MNQDTRRTRESYIPPGSTEEADPSSDAVVYLYAGPGGCVCAVAFVGRKAKPRWRYSFSSEAERRREIDRLLEERRRIAEDRAERARPHTLAVGDILYSSSGYEQTNVDFYQVTRALPASVDMRQIESVEVEAAPSAMRGTCTPVPGRFVGEVERYRVDGNNSVAIRKHVRASPWDGRPRHWSSYG